MKSKVFKFMLLAVGCWLLASTVQAQEVTNLKVLTNLKDSTYRFAEITTKDFDTVGVRYFPQNWLKKNEFKDFAYQLSKSENERKNEFIRLTSMVQKNIDFFAATIDEMGGAGTYAALQNNQLKERMQGAWSMIVKEDSKDPEVLTIVISGDQAATTDKTAAITWTSGTAFSMAKGITTAKLDFKQAEPNRFTAEQGGKKYVLKR